MTEPLHVHFEDLEVGQVIPLGACAVDAAALELFVERFLPGWDTAYGAPEGMTMADVVKVNVFMADLSEFATMNDVYGRYFSAPFPARAAVEVSRLPKDALVEIEAVAYKA